MKIDQLARTYQEQLERLGRKPSTLQQTQHALRGFLEFLEDDRAPDRNDISRYRAYLAQSGWSSSTTYAYFKVVRNWLNWAVLQDHLLLNPAKAFRDPSPHVQRRYTPTVTEMTRLLLGVPNQHQPRGQRDRVALEILYGTGLRRSELCSLDLQDYRRGPPALFVRAGKGYSDRLVPVGDQLKAFIEDYLANVRPKFQPQAQEPALMLCRSGERLLPGTLQYRLRRITQEVGLTRVTLHSFRHAYASHLLANGAKAHEVRLLLGHRQLRTTQIYTELQPLELMKEYRRTHPRARRGRA